MKKNRVHIISKIFSYLLFFGFFKMYLHVGQEIFLRAVSWVYNILFAAGHLEFIVRPANDDTRII